MKRTRTYRYTAYQQTGALVDGIIEAASMEEALESLWQRGLTPFETHEQDDGAGHPWRLGLRLQGNASRGDVAIFTRELATLVQAEVPLDDALRVISEQALAVRLRPILAAMLQDVLDGTHLSEAMSKHPRVFSEDYVNLIRAGEVSGNLGRGATELADLLDRRVELAARITSALIYPLILVIVAIVSVTIVIGVLVPAVAPIFNESGRPMPAVMGLLVALQRWWPAVLAATTTFVGLAFAVSILALRSTAVRASADRFLLALPLVGKLIQEQDAARFARTLGTLLRAGLPLMAAFGTACSVVRNQHMASGFTAALDDLRDGQSLARSLSRSPSIPSAALRLIAVGEEIGRLDQLLLRAAIMLEQQNQRRIERLMAVLTPALTVGLAVFVGTLVLTIMNAILAVNELALG